MSLHFHPLRVSAVRQDTEDAKVLTFDVPAPLRELFQFQPGQYLTLRTVLQGEEQRRSYSICAAAGDALCVGVRRVPGGAFSSWLHEQVKAGDAIDVMPPQGRFGAAAAHLTGQPKAAIGGMPRRQVLAEAGGHVLAVAGGHVLAVAGGSGITPILSILKTVLAGSDRIRCTLLYGNRQAASTMFKEELEDLKNRYLTRLVLHPVFSREVMDSPLNSGRLDAAKLHTLLRLVGPVDQAFVCGPHTMNDEVEAALLASGLAHEQVHVERFGIPPAAVDPALNAPQAGDAPTATITLVRDGLSRDVGFGASDGNILAAAVRAGLDMPYSCKSGVCATCRARLLQGQVRMERNFALEKDELAAGFVLTCQAHPLTERVVVSFDER